MAEKGINMAGLKGEIKKKGIFCFLVLTVRGQVDIVPSPVEQKPVRMSVLGRAKKMEN